MRREMEGYMTVEASMIMSIVLMVYLLLIRYVLWSYDRCVLEEEAAILLLKCTRTDEIEKMWYREINSRDTDKYVWISPDVPSFRKDGLKLMVKGSGKGGKLENMYIEYEMWNIVPQDWLRLKRTGPQITDEKE